MVKIFMLSAALSLCLGAAAQGEELHVGCNPEFPPFELTDDGNVITGFDIDILTAVGSVSGFTIVMHDQVFDSLLSRVESGEYDAVISGMTITEERRLRVDFSDPYYNAAQVIVTGDGVSGISTLDDIKENHTIGVQFGTTGAAMAEETMGKDNPNLKSFAKYNEVFNDLMLGKIDAVIVDLPVAESYVKMIPGFTIASKPLSSEQYGIAVKKGNKALLDRINAGLKAIRESGEYDAIAKKWFD